MEFVKLTLDRFDGYSYADASNIAMCILGRFLRSDVGYSQSIFRKWALDDSMGTAASGNITALEKEGDYIFLTDLYSEEKEPTELKISRERFVQLLDEWYEICKQKSKEVIIKHIGGDQFIIETSE